MRTTGIGLAFVVLSLAAGAEGQQPVPFGSEFRVNTYTSYDQSSSYRGRSVATDASGGFVVVWQSSEYGYGYSYVNRILGQRFDSNGARRGSEFQVENATTYLVDAEPSVAMSSSGDFVVVWSKSAYYGGGAVQARRFASGGAPRGIEFEVATPSLGYSFSPAVAMDGSGNFLVAWNDGDVRARRFSSNGTPRGSEFRVNATTAYSQQDPSLGMNGDGSFVVAWERSEDYYGDPEIFGQRFSSGGARLGGEFRVSSGSTDQFQVHPAAAMDAGGGFVVAWQRGSGSESKVFAQRYDSGGNSLGSEFPASSSTTTGQQAPDVGMEPGGGFAVVWQSYAGYGSSASVFSRTFASSGAPRGVDTQVNTTASGDELPSVGMSAPNDFVVVWTKAPGYPQDADVYARRFGSGPLLAVEAVSIDDSSGNGNGDLDGNECVRLRITLRNIGTATAEAFSAALSTTSTGTEVLQDASAYPQIPVGGTGANTTAFQVRTSQALDCGRPVELLLQGAVGGRSFELPVPIQPGVLTPAPTFSATGPVAIPDDDPNGATLPLTVSGVAGTLDRITVSLHLTHTWDGDLEIRLIGPDGTNVVLASREGGSGDNYGAGCPAASAGTTFDDEAGTSVAAGAAPFLGIFRPDEALAAFVGKSGVAVNGTWKLRVEDQAAADIGNIECWSLTLGRPVCADGGGRCAEQPQSTPPPTPTQPPLPTPTQTATSTQTPIGTPVQTPAQQSPTPALSPTSTATPMPTPIPPGASVSALSRGGMGLLAVLAVAVAVLLRRKTSAWRQRT
jgi:subtilisin-like proprotein convertase family protein